MKIRSIFSAAMISCLALTAVSCGDDNDKDKKSECDNTTLTCASETSKNVCKDGSVVAEPCGQNEVCKDNVCSKKDSEENEGAKCGNTTLTCASETSKNVCKDGSVVAEPCEQNEVCKDNVCSKKDSEEKENLAGDTCTVDVCYKNIPHYCDKGSHKLFITEEEDPSCGADAVCEVTDEINAFCLESCETVGVKKFVCGQNQIQQYSAEAVCTQFPDGKLALYVDESDSDNTEFCEEECIEGRCLDQKPTTEDKDQPCEQESYGLHCDDNKLVFCGYYNKVDVSDCGSFEKVCRTDAGNSKNSACVVDDDSCDNPGDITYSCREEGEEYNFETLLITECVKATDNKNYKFVDSKRCDIGTCTAEGGCTPY